MIKKLAAFAPILIGCASTAPINVLPMYGGVAKNESQANADNDFLKTIDAQGQTRDSSSRFFSNRGWSYYYQGNDNLAMKRFNQAWLLNPNNASAYFGFGSIIGRRRSSIDSAIMFFKIAYKLDTGNIPIATSLAYAFGEKSYQLKSKSDPKWQAYKDTSLTSYKLLLSKIQPESDQGLQHLGSLEMLGENKAAGNAIAKIDSTKLAARQLPWYRFLISEYEKQK